MTEQRAHHNELEKNRRDHIKDSFRRLRESVPSLNTEKTASRVQILKKAAEYIVHMRKRDHAHLQDIDKLKRQNTFLEAQIRALEKARATGSFGVDAQDGNEPNYDETESDTSDLEESVHPEGQRSRELDTTHKRSLNRW